MNSTMYYFKGNNMVKIETDENKVFASFGGECYHKNLKDPYAYRYSRRIGFDSLHRDVIVLYFPDDTRYEYHLDLGGNRV